MARLIRYLENLGDEDARTGRDRHRGFRLRFRGHAGRAESDAAGLLNTPILVAEATANPRYAWERNQGVPRKIGSKLWLYDCINCDKCVPVCPNDANFVYEAPAAAIEYDNFELLPGGVRARSRRRAARGEGAPVGQLRRCLQRVRQLRHLLPRRRRPAASRSRAFSAAWKPTGSTPARNGFYIDWDARHTIHGTIAGKRIC